MTANPGSTSARRAILALSGLAAGLALWAMGERWHDPVIAPALLLAAFAFVLVESWVMMALADTLAPGRAALRALWIAVPVTALISLAGLRYDPATRLVGDPVTLAAAAVLVLVGVPFLLVRVAGGRDWRDYPALFDAAWRMHVRHLIAWAFVGVVWVVIFASDQLLKLVDVNFISFVLRQGWVGFGLSGLALGLAMAVLHEMRDTVSPFLVLRLLRLLVPLVLLVLAVFLAVLPWRGLGGLFGEFSATGTLVSAGLAVITLICIAIDRDDTQAVATRGISLATRALAVMLPVLAGLSLWAVMLRVAQYGWTPDRVLGAAAGGVLLAYGLSYGVAALRPGGWMARIRRANVWLGLLVLAVAALWLTPVLDPYRISTSSQVSRYLRGQSGLDQLPLWELAHDWGRPGLNALDRLDAMPVAAGGEALTERIAAARDSTSTWLFRQAVEARDRPERVARLTDLLAVRPEGAALPRGALDKADGHVLDQVETACDTKLPDGRPGCALVIGRFLPGLPQNGQAILLMLDRNRVNALFLAIEQGGLVQRSNVIGALNGDWPELDAADLARVLDGDFAIRPSGGNALWLGSKALQPGR